MNPALSLYTDLRLKVTDRFSISADYEYNFFNNTHVQTGVGINYKAQCWSLRLTFTREDDEEKYDFMIGLHGLGEFESGI